MLRIIEFSHHIIKTICKDGQTFVDMTAGNGNDTLFLEENFPNSKIFAFDTQLKAIEKTKAVTSFTQVIHDSHENVKDYVSNADMFLFNLGYLPGGDETITTKSKTTLKALRQAIDLLNKDGIIIVVIYIGHIEGYAESTVIDHFCENLDNTFDTYTYKLLNKKDAPYINIIKRK